MGTPFWAYASWWVRQAMQRLISELARPVVLSDRALRQLARIKHAQRELAQARRAEPDAAEVAEHAGLAPDQVRTLMAAERASRTLDEPVAGDDASSATLGELLRDPRAEDDYEAVPRRFARSRLPSMLDGLDPRERRVICSRFGLHGRERTLRELGEVLGVSAERVRQIEEASLSKLRAASDL
jgi:RNA polymerase sigma factor (sigma-70 family)